MSTSRIEQFEAFLARENRQLTHERRVVAEIVFASAGPLDAESVFKAVVESPGPRRVSRASSCLFCETRAA